MVGLVIVSHSRKLAEALAALIKGTGNKDIPVAATGGVGDNAEEFGTDAAAIADAVNSVYSDEGVLILTDLGSSVLSSELALDFLSDAQKSHIKVSSAPLVEGAFSAAVQIGLNASLADTAREAEEGLYPKQEQLNQNRPESGPGRDTDRDSPGTQNRIEQILTVHTEHGLHARPAAQLIRLIGTFDADAEISNVSKKRGPVSAKSLNKLLSLNVLKDDKILISAAGAQAQLLVDAVTARVHKNFGETIQKRDTGAQSIQKEEKSGNLIAVSDGITAGKAFIIAGHIEEVKKAFTTDREKEQHIFTAAAEEVEKNILKRKKALTTKISGQETEIFDAHLLLLKDPELYDAALQLIRKEGYTAAYAWAERVKAVNGDYERLSDDYLRQRAKDVLDVGSQMAEILSGKQSTILSDIKTETGEPVILFTDELTPSQAASLNSDTIKGVVTRYGGPTSHTAILCRALGIPAVCGFAAFDTISEGTMVVIDGTKGQVKLHPTAGEIAAAQHTAVQRTAEREKAQLTAGIPALTADGDRIQVYANLALPEDAQTAVRYGAEGVGLFRTEFLFLNRTSAPDEQEQYEAFMKAGKAFGQKPVIIRTFDIGGDKQIDYMKLPDEENPFLGVRGVRLYEKNKALFTVHIRAILRAADLWNFRIMVPMITEAEECAYIRQEIGQIHIKMEEEGIKHRWPIPIGAMIETPAAAVLTGVLSNYADFFSIGSNDLTQYVMAAERGNQALSHFADPIHPAVLSVIRQAVEGAHRHGKEIGLCGEMGSDKDGIAALIGLGIDEISLSPVRIPEVKDFIRTLHRSELEVLIPGLEERKNAKEMHSFIKKLVSDPQEKKN